MANIGLQAPPRRERRGEREGIGPGIFVVAF